MNVIADTGSVSGVIVGTVDLQVRDNSGSHVQNPSEQVGIVVPQLMAGIREFAPCHVEIPEGGPAEAVHASVEIDHVFCQQLRYSVGIHWPQ